MNRTLLNLLDTTWTVSTPEGGANTHFFVPEWKKGYFESLAPQDFQNNLPSRVLDSFGNWSGSPQRGAPTPVLGQVYSTFINNCQSRMACSVHNQF